MRAVAKVRFKYRLQQHFEALLDRPVFNGLGPAAKLIAAIGPSHDRHLPTKKTSRVVHDHGIPDVRLYRGRTEVEAVHHLRNGPLPHAQGPVARWRSSAAL
jgi:hypothetical protein